MLARALVIGVNAYPSAPLRGCVIDAGRADTVMERALGFTRPNEVSIRLMCDDRATRKHIMERGKWLADADVGILFQSGHGTRTADRNGDESDGLDEAFCPFDFAWGDRDTWMFDDDYAEIFAANPEGRFYLISDSCHSGDLAKGVRQGAFLGRAKTLPLPLDIAHQNRQVESTELPLRRLVSTLPDNVLAISACRSDQVAMDGNPEGEGGAFSWAFWSLVRSKPERPVIDLIASVNSILYGAGYTQEANASGHIEWLTEPLPKIGE